MLLATVFISYLIAVEGQLRGVPCDEVLDQTTRALGVGFAATRLWDSRNGAGLLGYMAGLTYQRELSVPGLIDKFMEHMELGDFRVVHAANRALENVQAEAERGEEESQYIVPKVRDMQLLFVVANDRPDVRRPLPAPSAAVSVSGGGAWRRGGLMQDVEVDPAADAAARAHMAPAFHHNDDEDDDDDDEDEDDDGDDDEDQSDNGDNADAAHEMRMWEQAGDRVVAAGGLFRRAARSHRSRIARALGMV